MSFDLKKKTYDRRYLLLLPFQCSPVCAAGVLLQKIVTGMVNILWILIEARAIDLAADCTAGRAEWKEVLSLLPVFLLMAVWKRMGYNIGRILTAKAENDTVFSFWKEIVKKCSRVPFRILEERRFQEIKASLLEASEFGIWTMSQQTGNFLLYMIRTTGVCALLALERAWLGILVFLLMGPFLYFSFRSRQRTRKEYISQYTGCARRGLYLDQILKGRSAAKERALFAYTGYVQRIWEEQTDRFLKMVKRKLDRTLGANTAEVVILGVVFFLITAVRISLLAEGAVSLGMFIALSRGVYDMMVFLHNGVDATILPMEGGSDFLKELTAFASMPEAEGTNDLPAKEAEEFEKLEFKKASFRYPRTAKYVLKELSATLTRGGRYAFVGENGAGKTTIAKLLTGAYDSYEGSILLNGIELRDYAPERRKAMFAAVYQDSARYDDTAAVNILLGNARDLGQREKMEQAAKTAGVYDDIMSLPQGFDTLLGKQAGEGVELSDGHWQKIIMARLLMNPAPFYLLDEPAAALDPIAESRLYEKFEQISKGKTTLSISHRLGSTKRADRIFVLKEGTVVEEGRHEELIKRQGLYAEMYERQRGWYRR